MIRPLFVGAALCLAAATAAAEPLRIHAANAPLAHAAQHLAGPEAEVTMPIPEGTDPETWRPGIAEIAAMQEADLILLHGAELYGWTQRISLPRARVVDTIRGFPPDALIEVEGITHSHGDEPEHSHAALATKTWLDFRLAALQAAAVAEAIARLRPDDAAAVDERLSTLQAELAALDSEVLEIGRTLDGELVLAAHRGYEYLAARAGIELETFDWDPWAPLDGEALAEVDAVLTQRPARIMLFPVPPTLQAETTLAERGLSVVVLDTAASAPTSDVFEIVAAGLADLKAASAR